MDYFVETTLDSPAEPSEKAALARLDVFNALHRYARLYLTDYSPVWAGIVPDSQRNRVTGLFDQVQQAAAVAPRLFSLQNLDGVLGLYDRRTASAQRRLYEYTDGDRVIAGVHLFENGGVDTVTFVGTGGATLEVDQYDARGFLSRRQVRYANRLVAEEYLTPHGEVRLELTYGATGRVELVREPDSGETFSTFRTWQRHRCEQALRSAENIVSSEQIALDLLKNISVRKFYYQPGQLGWVRKSPSQAKSRVVIDEFSEEQETIITEWAKALG